MEHYGGYGNGTGNGNGGYGNGTGNKNGAYGNGTGNGNDYNTRHSSSLHLSVGRGEAIYRSFSFHGINIWNYLKMHVPIDVSYIRFKKLTISYLIANDIVYRIKS